MKIFLSAILLIKAAAAQTGAPATDAPTYPSTDAPTRYYGEYAVEWEKRERCFTSVANTKYIAQLSTGNLDVCKETCDHNDACIGFIKKFQGCGLLGVDSVCVPYKRSGSWTFYNRTATKSVTSAPTTSPTTDAPTASPTVAPTVSPTASPTISPTESPTRYHGNYSADANFEKRFGCKESLSAQNVLENFLTKTLAQCEIECDLENACVALIKTKNGCKLQSADSVCTPQTRSGSQTRYIRVGDKRRTEAPTVSPTDAPTESPTTSPTVSPTSSPTRYFGNYTVEFANKNGCTQSNTQSKFLKIYNSNEDLAFCKLACDLDNDCIAFLDTLAGCKLMGVDSKCSPKTAKGTVTKYERIGDARKTEAPTDAPTTASPTATPTTASPTATPTDAPTSSPTRAAGVYATVWENRQRCFTSAANSKYLKTYNVGNLEVCKGYCDLDNDCIGIIKKSPGCSLMGVNSVCVPYQRSGAWTYYNRTGDVAPTASPTDTPTTGSPTTASPTGSPTPQGTDPPSTKSPTNPGTNPPSTKSPTTPGTGPNPTDSPTDAGGDDDGLSGGAKAGIAIGVIVGIAAAGAGIMMFGKKGDESALNNAETEIVAAPDGKKVEGHAPHDAL